ncbi:hypothetical protein VP01_3973g5 [Puccinia sorghi]|uniref:Uncharacterized protein n=1 Tax=Puccinia sorghi TaxID=27349 RepID=A0A0L6US80_9BASI|nr:hypothetical protein VP01_3973g5 [Puccinia sorghi]
MPSISQSNSIRTKLNQTNKTLLNDKTWLCSLALNYPVSEIHDITELVVGGSLKHPPKSTHSRAWKANQISSASQSSLFPPWKMIHSCFPSPLSLCSNLPRQLWHLVTKTYSRTVWEQARLTALRTIVSTESQHDLHNQTYFSTWLFLKELYQRVVVEFQRISTELRTKFTKIRLNLCIPYNQHTTGTSSVYAQVLRKNLHASTMERALVTFAASALSSHFPYICVARFLCLLAPETYFCLILWMMLRFPQVIKSWRVNPFLRIGLLWNLTHLNNYFGLCYTKITKDYISNAFPNSHQLGVGIEKEQWNIWVHAMSLLHVMLFTNLSKIDTMGISIPFIPPF